MRPPAHRPPTGAIVATTPYAELHAHTNFSFLDGASPPDELVRRAVELGLTGLAATDHNGLYGAVRFMSAVAEAGLHGVVGTEIELLDPAVADPRGVVIPPRRARRRGQLPEATPVEDGRPARPRPERARLPGHRDPVKEDLRGIGARARGPHLVLLARSSVGWRSLCRLLSRANLAGTKGMPRFRHALLDEHHEDVIALSGGRSGEIGRRLLVGDRAGARAAAERFADIFGEGGFHIELSHHLRPDDDWLVAESVVLAADLGLPVVVTNAVHYARVEDREFHDVLTAIRHGRTLDTLADLRRPDGESYLKSGEELAALGASMGGAAARAWREGIERSVSIAAACVVDLGFEQYRFPGFPVPDGETPFSHLVALCQEGARRRYHPITPVVVRQLAHELDVIERTGLAEFFLICWDLMRFAREQGIPAQGRGSAAGSIVAYALGISRVEPIRHNLLFERFINEGRTTYPDVDIDFSSERREEVIQYVYRRYGPEHTGMVCNLVTYRARSAVREVGVALGFPRPLVDRVAKALETYDSVMVRRDLEADGGFAEFFRGPGEAGAGVAAGAGALAEARGLTDRMGQLNHGRGGRLTTGGTGGQGHGPSGAGIPLPVEPPRLEGAERGSTTPRALHDGRVHAQQAWVAREVEDSTDPWDSPSPHRSTGGGIGGHMASRSPTGGAGEALAPRTAIRAGGTSDDEGGPGDTPASVAWLRAGRGSGYAAGRELLVPSGLVDGRAIDPESGQLEPAPPHRDKSRSASRAASTRKNQRLTTCSSGTVHGGAQRLCARSKTSCPTSAKGQASQPNPADGR